MADYILYDGRYSGEEIDSFLSRVERTGGNGPLQPELAGTKAVELPYGQYMTVTKQVESDGSVTLIFGVPRGTQGERGYQGIQGEPGPEGKTAYQSAVDGGFTGTEAEFNAMMATISGYVHGASGSAEAAAESAATAAESEENAAESEANASASESGAAASAADAETWARYAEAEAERATVPPVEGVYNVILTDRVTAARYALIVDSGRLELLQVASTLDAVDLTLIDQSSGTAYGLIVESGKLKLQEAG